MAYMDDTARKANANDAAQATTNRRGFLKLASAGTMAGAVAAVSGVDKVEAAESKAGQSIGYRETDHVKRFYQTARF